jgi:leader peptidase (prepilin peptidase)/N-methyltransferase
VTDGLVPAPLLVAGWALLGLLVGSFLNVVIHRVPAGLSLVTPGSACPACGHAVRGHDNVPVLSWVVLRGRCRDCRTPISGRYPLVELTSAALFASAAWRFGWSPYTVAVTALLAAGLALFMIDLDHRRLPFSITGFTAVAVVLALVADGWVAGWEPVATAVLSTLVWAGVYGGVWLLTAGRGMGLGDVALAPVLGLVLGWSGWGPSLVGLLGGFVIGALVGVGLLAAGLAHGKARVPHGPFMLAGAVLGLYAGQPLWGGYLRIFGLGSM